LTWQVLIEQTEQARSYPIATRIGEMALKGARTNPLGQHAKFANL